MSDFEPQLQIMHRPWKYLKELVLAMALDSRTDDHVFMWEKKKDMHSSQ